MDSSLSPRCLSLDLEVGKQDRCIHAFAAVRPNVDQPIVFHGGDLATALAELDDFAVGADFLLGHNLIDFDLHHLEAAKPDLRLLKLPAVDTLRLNPLACPAIPITTSVKHYQVGQLKLGRLNDPELDARLALDEFDDQQTALRAVPRGLLEAWQRLTGIGTRRRGIRRRFRLHTVRAIDQPTRQRTQRSASSLRVSPVRMAVRIFSRMPAKVAGRWLTR